MSEENASVETEQATEQTTTSFVDADGKLVDNWQSHAPKGYEDLADDASLKTIKSVWDMGKSYVHVRKQVPLDKTALPNDKWGEGDWNEWHKAGGRPETSADYGITRHEEIPEESMTKEMIDGYQDLFHRIGLSKKQADAISEYNTDRMLAQMKTMAQTQEDSTNETIDSLRKEWGLAYDQNVHRGNVAIEKDKDIGKDPAYKARLLEKVNKDPDLIRFASNMGFKFVEHKIIEDPGIPSPGDLQTQIAEIMADKRYSHIDLQNNQPMLLSVYSIDEDRLLHQGDTRINFEMQE